MKLTVEAASAAFAAGGRFAADLRLEPTGDGVVWVDWVTARLCGAVTCRPGGDGRSPTVQALLSCEPTVVAAGIELKPGIANTFTVCADLPAGLPPHRHQRRPQPCLAAIHQ